jgi:hypothetical protein
MTSSADPGFMVDGGFILDGPAMVRPRAAQKASADRAITGPAPVLSFAKWAEASGRIRSRK